MFYRKLSWVVLLLSSTTFLGCASIPPHVEQFSNGNSYLISDKCAHLKYMSSGDLACYSKNDLYVGLAHPLSDAEIKKWKQIQKQHKEFDSTEFWLALAIFFSNLDFQNNYAQSSSDDIDITPHIHNFDFNSTPGSNRSLRNVRSVGDNSYLVGSDLYRVNDEGTDRYRVSGPGGSTVYHRVGPNVVSSDGTTLQKTGPVIRGSDGSKCMMVGTFLKCN